MGDLLNESLTNCLSAVKISWWNINYISRRHKCLNEKKNSENESKRRKFSSCGNIVQQTVSILPINDNLNVTLAIKNANRLF